jgi:hypothetical protein
MATQKEQDLIAVWRDKINAAETYHRKWAKEYKVELLEAFEEGFQQRDEMEEYVLNLFYSTIEIKTPSIVFRKPTVTLKPTPSALALDSESAFQFARNNEDLINTWLLDPDNTFATELLEAISDAWSRFGILEIGYSASWVDNPKIRRPKIKSDYRPGVDKRSQRTVDNDPEKVPKDEKVYAKNIPAKDFLVSTGDSNELIQCDWCGYRETVRLEDLLASNLVKNKGEIEESNSLAFGDGSSLDLKIFENNDDGYINIWKIWDIRASRKYIFTDSVQIYDRPYKVFPLYDLRFKRRKKNKGFFPLPFTFNWLSPQIEINDVRNAHANHRKRFKRIYQLNENKITDTREEAEKLLYGPDGTVISVQGDNAITLVPNGDLGMSAQISLATPLDDFNRLAGSTKERRGESDRTTATQAALIEKHASIRDSKERDTVAEFIQRTLKGILLLFRNNAVNPIPVIRGQEQTLLENIQFEDAIEEIDPVFDIGDDEFDFYVMLQISSMSPVASEEEKQKFIEFLTMLAQYPQFSISPLLIRELAFRTGYYNEKVIQELQKLAQLQLIGLTQQLGGQIQGAGGENTNNLAKQMTPPTGEQVRNQIQGQGIPL